MITPDALKILEALKRGNLRFQARKQHMHDLWHTHGIDPGCEADMYMKHQMPRFIATIAQKN
jgi:hypothetical protein